MTGRRNNEKQMVTVEDRGNTRWWGSRLWKGDWGKVIENALHHDSLLITDAFIAQLTPYLKL